MASPTLLNMLIDDTDSIIAGELVANKKIQGFIAFAQAFEYDLKKEADRTAAIKAYNQVRKGV